MSTRVDDRADRGEPGADTVQTVTQDVLAAAGWAVFVGGGIAIGLLLGSLGADVPADPEMLVFVGLIAAALTLVVRVGLIAVKRGLSVAQRSGPTTARRTSDATERDGRQDRPALDPDEPPLERPVRARPRPPRERTARPARRAGGGRRATTARARRPPRPERREPHGRRPPRRARRRPR